MRINNLIARFLVNKATKEEWEQLDTWKQESQDNLTELKEIQSIWHDSVDLKDYKVFNQNKAWENIDNQISDETSSSVRSNTRLYLKYIGAAAAAIIIVLFAVFKLYAPVESGYYSFYSNDLVKEFQLPDGSQIALNKNSTLKYANDFEVNRKIELEGEAFFDVKRDEEHEFSISTPCANVKVLGTSFNIDEKDDYVSIFVKSGRVKVESAGEEVILEKNEMVKCDCKNIKVLSNPGINYLSWKTNKLEFNDTPLHLAIQDISRHYGISLGFNKESIAMNIKISDTFTNQSLESVLESIVLITGINYLKQGNKFIIQ